MGKATVYKVQLYDAANDEPITSRRLATRQGAEMMQGNVLENTAIEIDESQLEHGQQWTEKNFNPTPRIGFQTRVTG
jgi:hypothetical protein